MAANFGIGIITFFGMLLAMIPVVLGIFAIASDLTVLGVISIALGVLALIAVSLISLALSSILLGALYLYASDGEVPQQFDGGQLSNAFVRKKK